jgi:hypothetical protein
MDISNLIECFKKVINIPSCDTNNTGGIQINQLPGISIKSLQSIAKEEQESYINVVNDIIMRAIYRIINDLSSYITIELNNYGQVLCYGRLEQDKDGYLIPVDATTNTTLVGGLVSVSQSKFLTLYIDSFRFYSPRQQTGVFYLLTTQNNQIIETYTVDLVAGENNIIVNKHFYPTNYSRTIAIVYDSSTLEHYKTNSLDCYDACPCDCTFVCSSGVSSNGNRIAEIPAGGVLGHKWTNSQDTYGISVTYGLNCDLGVFICQNINKFSNILMYAVQIEYYLELIGSSRLNKFTTTKASDYEKIYDVATKDYVNSYKTLSKSLNFCDNCCFPCKNSGFIKSRYIKP